MLNFEIKWIIQSLLKENATVMLLMKAASSEGGSQLPTAMKIIFTFSSAVSS